MCNWFKKGNKPSVDTQAVGDIIVTDTLWKSCPKCGMNFPQAYVNDGADGWYAYNWHMQYGDHSVTVPPVVPVTGENMYQCTLPKTIICGEEFETGLEINKHKMKEHPEFMVGAVFCEVCGELILATDTTQGAENFRAHMDLHTAEEAANKVVCPVCGENYKDAHMVAHNG